MQRGRDRFNRRRVRDGNLAEIGRQLRLGVGAQAVEEVGSVGDLGETWKVGCSGQDSVALELGDDDVHDREKVERQLAVGRREELRVAVDEVQKAGVEPGQCVRQVRLELWVREQVHDGKVDAIVHGNGDGLSETVEPVGQQVRQALFESQARNDLVGDAGTERVCDLRVCCYVADDAYEPVSDQRGLVSPSCECGRYESQAREDREEAYEQVVDQPATPHGQWPIALVAATC